MELMSSTQADMFFWRKERADMAIKRHAPDCPHVIADICATGVAAEEVSPSEFEALLRNGCKPITALDILK